MSEELPLRSLHERHKGLTVAIAGCYEEAASVCLHRHHASPVDFSLIDREQLSEKRGSWENSRPSDSKRLGE